MKPSACLKIKSLGRLLTIHRFPLRSIVLDSGRVIGFDPQTHPSCLGDLYILTNRTFPKKLGQRKLDMETKK